MVLERWRPGRGLIPLRPFRDLEEKERRFDDLFSRPFLSSFWRRMPMQEFGWIPAIDVFEKGDKFVLKAELPGMSEEDIDVSIEGDTLTIKGERKAENEVKEEDYHCCERSYGSFSRTISVPSNVDVKKIEASFDDGVLEINLPKVPEVKSKKVPISTKKVITAKKKSSTEKMEKGK